MNAEQNLIERVEQLTRLNMSLEQERAKNKTKLAEYAERIKQQRKEKR
jgi:hypothetical protein